MLSKDFHRTDNFLLGEFQDSVRSFNVSKAKTTAFAFIVVEFMLLIATWLIKRERLFVIPDLYYIFLYFFMLVVMTVFFLIFIRLEKAPVKNLKLSRMVGAVFTTFILAWSAAISLLDQLTSGQIIVYVVAIIFAAMTPIFRPLILTVIFAVPHLIFLALLPYVQLNKELLFRNSIYSTAFLIIAFALSAMRYLNRIKDFQNQKLQQENSTELQRVNQELAEANYKLELLSKIDRLTGIYNRFAFDEMLKKEWARCKRHGFPLSLIMADIDRFKSFNDKHGHQAGDACIKQVAEVLAACAKRSSDVVARYGGEEFAILLPHMSMDEAYSLAELMRTEVEGLLVTIGPNSYHEHITISLGLHTVIPSDQTSIEELIRTADKALYQAKNLNRNNVVSA